MTEEKKEYGSETDDEDDIQELREVLEVVSEKVPKLIKEIVDAVYNNQDPDEYGRSVASFYKQLTDAGMDPEQAYRLTEKFMDSRDLPSLISKIIEKEGGLNFGPGMSGSGKKVRIVRNGDNVEIDVDGTDEPTETMESEEE